MKTYCHYHPEKLAQWSCPKCDKAYCNECVDVRKGGPLLKQDLYFCRTCNIETQWVGAANLIDPFWQRLPKFFSYPLRPAPLGFMLALAFGSTIFVQPGLFSLLMRILLWGLLFKYAFTALKATASGDLVAPGISQHTIFDDFFQVFKQVAVYLVIGFIFGWLVATAGIMTGLAFLIPALFLVPAMLIMLVTTNSLLHAINPAIFIRLALRIGKGYFLMFFFLFLLGAAPAVVGQYLFALLPPRLLVFVVAFAKCYYTIISYHLMGYVILQYHEEVGYEVDQQNFRDPVQEKTLSTREEPNAQFLQSLNILVTEGKLDEAIELIKSQSAETGITDLTISERYFSLLKMKKRKKDLLEHCVTHLKLLCQANQKSKSCQLYSQCMALDENFTPTADALFKVGGWLNESGKSREAIGVYSRLIKSFPQNALVPKAYLRSAQIFHDRLMKPDQAKKILHAVIRKYPDSDVTGQVKAYLAHI